MELPEKNIKFVFDMAGVLVNWDTNALYSQIFPEDENSKDVFFAEVMNHDAQNLISQGVPVDQVVNELIDEFPQWQKAISAYWDRWDEMLVGEISGTVSVIEELKERGCKVYLLGNWGRGEFERAKSRLSFIDFFDDILLSGDCGILKPDPGIFEIAEDRFKLITEQTIFIDDKKENVDAGIDRGWNGIVFENPRQLYLTLMEYSIL